MSIAIDQQTLQKQLDFLVPIAKQRSPLPILENIVLNMESAATSELYASNLEIYVKSKIKPDVIQPIKTTVKAEKLYEILKNMRTDTPVEISELSRGRILVSQKPSTQFTLNGLAVEDFPSFPTHTASDSTAAIAINAKELLDTLNATTYAAASDTSRFNLNAVFVTARDNKAIFVTTDGHRLSLRETSSDITLPDGIKGYLLPRSSAIYLAKWLPRVADETLNISIYAKAFSIETAEYNLSMRLLDGDYPDFNRVIPSNPTNPLTVNRNELLAAVRRVGLMTNDHGKGIHLIYDGNDKLDLSANNPDLGEATDSIAIEAGNIANFHVIINKDYLVDGLSAMTSEKALVYIDDRGGPILFKSSAEDKNLTLVMPMRM